MATELSALDFKSATLYAIRVVLQHSDTQDLIGALKKRMADAGTFFENEPVVIDALGVEALIDWGPLLKAFADHRLPVIGVVAQGDNLAAAKTFGLTAVDLSSSPTRCFSSRTCHCKCPSTRGRRRGRPRRQRTQLCPDRV